jgi:glutamine synthetase
MQHAESPASASQLAAIEYPSEGELVFSPRYTVRVKASGAGAVEVSFDAGSWQPCRFADGHWWHDWSDYAPGAHVICARVAREDGGYDTLRPRTFRVALPASGISALQTHHAQTGAISQALWTLRQNQVQFVQLWFCDVNGKPWRISLPVAHINEEAFTAGITLDGPSTAEPFRAYITLLPDPESLFNDPLATVPTAAVICDLIEPPDVGAAALGVRQVLQKAEERLAAVEPGLSATFGAEPEFFLLEPDGRPAPEEDVWDFLTDLARTLGDAGIQSEGFRYGPARGQGRVQMRWARPLRTADHVILYRWFAKVLARRRGKQLTFEARPDAGQGAATMPVHHSLWLGVNNAFHDKDGWELVSQRCLSYTAGLLTHSSALAAIVAPTERCYPLRAGSQISELKPLLSRDDNSALCRIPARLLNPGGRRLKFKAGIAGGNPYLSLAALLLAGVDGLKRGLQPEIDATQRALPRTLGEALDALDADRQFLKDGGFSDRLIDAWIDGRRANPRRGAVEA